MTGGGTGGGAGGYAGGSTGGGGGGGGGGGEPCGFSLYQVSYTHNGETGENSNFFCRFQMVCNGSKGTVSDAIPCDGIFAEWW